MKRVFLFLTALVAMAFFAKAQTCDTARNLAATPHVGAWEDVRLSCSEPASVAALSATISHCGTYAPDYSIGTGTAVDFMAAIRFPVGELATHDGEQLKAVKFIPTLTTCQYSIRVWTGGSATAPGTLVVDMPLSNDDLDFSGVYNTITLTTPVTIDITEELWIGVRYQATEGYPAANDGASDVSTVDGVGNMMYFDGTWQSLLTLGSTLVGNWCIQGIVSSADSPLAHYQVKKNGTVLGTVSATNYLDLGVALGTHTYEVSAVYNDNCTSLPISATLVMDPSPCQQIITTYPYNYDFSDDFINRYCWNVEDANSDGTTWQFDFYSSYGYSAYYEYNEDYGANDFLISPEFALTGSEVLTFNYFTSDAYDEKFSVWLFGPDTLNVLPTTTIPASDADIIFDANVSLSAATGNYRIAFNCESDADQFRLYIQNVEILQTSAPLLEILSTDSINFGTLLLGDTAVAMVTMRSANTDGNLTITTDEAQLLVSSQPDANFAASLTLPARTTLTFDTIYIMYLPTIEGSINATFEVTDGATLTDNILVKGNAIDLGNPFYFGVTGDSAITTCDRYILDDGGFSGDYSLNSNYTLTIYPDEPGHAVRLQGTYVVENGYDFLYIYNGVGVNTALLLGTFSSDDEDSINVVSTVGPITIQLVSDNEINKSGFLLKATCEEAELETVVVLDYDTIFFMPQETGDSTIEVINLTAFNNDAAFDVSVPAGNFYVSTDGETWGTTATIPAEGGELYLLYTSGEAGNHDATITITNGDTTMTVWASGISAECHAITTFPYQFGFNVDDPQIACWGIEDANGDATVDGNGTFSFLIYDPTSNPGCAAFFPGIDTNIANANDWLISPEFALPTQPMRAKFDYIVGYYDYYGLLQIPGPETYSVWVIPAGGTYETATCVIPERTVSNYQSFATQRVDLSAYVNQTIQIGIKVSSARAESYYFVVDNFIIEELPEPPVCEPLNLPFTEDFEGEEEEVLGCYLNIDADNDGFMWTLNTTPNTMAPHSGNNVMISESYSNEAGMALTPNNFLATPQLIIPADGAMLTYWVAPQDGNYPAEHYEVMVSEGGETPADFVSVFEETLTEADVDFVQRTVSLAAYANKTIRIAFVHNECSDMFMMKIDDINVTAGAPVDPGTGINDDNAAAAVSVYPNPTNSVLNVAAENFNTVEVLNFLGQVVYSSEVTDSNFQINVASLNAGIYFVRLTGADNYTVTKKFVKE